MEFPSAVVTRTTQNTLAIFAMTVLGLTAILLIGGMVWMFGHGTVNRPGVAEPPSPAAVDHEASPTSKPAAAVVADAHGELILSGVVEGLGEPYAVINGMIVGAGDRIANATLLEITSGVVKIRRDDGKELTLRVPR